MSPELRDAYRDLEPHRDEGRLVRLDVDECLRLLATESVGRVAINDQGGPVVFPVNYLVDRGSVVFRTGVGSKLGAADARDEASFEVDHVDRQDGTGWSVLVRGRLVEVANGDEVDRLSMLPLRPLVDGDRDHLLQVMARTISGRRISAREVATTAGAIDD